ncbi:hypothetical protein NSZ01_16550 [Nocardioides szechwanensis]|uniref:Uncharacterized protein n=1 Tax=Nocardioides szechwanensis TaxID=1005944 RepID=A0A1G9ZBW6_9ACTN|nr:hypothetical protein [Nocardioides szechwanensis]GEP33887.1 hypothetical protein NSZ01_16550 [Nocardioides szechwanensis]SDN18898.1 hypothetical protein SAMN05192576_1682 [Nocardioides szechwanensis]
MDLSALIFVALAVAWAVYLIPKALRHHDDAGRSRSVERFSHTMRVLARREPTSRRSARLVVTPGRPASNAVPVVEVPVAEVAPSRQELQVRRAAAAAAAKRRLRVVSLIGAANLVVVALAIGAVISWPYVAIPVAVLVMWLVACRLMVKRERAADAPVARLPLVETETETDGPITEEISAVVEEVEVERDPNAWDPVPVTLPTYVTKEQATRRTVRTIDLDSTGVWTSGRTESDSAIAREADQAERAAKSARADDEARRATGS